MSVDTDRVWEAQRHLALLGCYTGRIDGLDGDQTQQAIQRAIDRHNHGVVDGWYDTVRQKVRDMQPSNPRHGEAVLLADINRICDILTLGMNEHKGYAAATIWKETGYTMQPVEEAFYLSPAAREKYLRGQPYWPHFGRGDTQFTWLSNYQWMTSLFTPASAYVNGRVPDDYPTNFVANPDGLLNPEVSLVGTLVGMYIGAFRRNHPLKRYINENGVDMYGARNVINGVVTAVAREIEDKAWQYTKEFERMNYAK